METKYIELAGYICHSITMLQIIEKDKLFEFCKRRFDWIDKDIFNNVIDSMQKTAGITGVTDKYIYQTTSTLKKQKDSSEIIKMIEL